MTFTRLIINTVALVGVALSMCVYLHNNFGKRSHEGSSHQSSTQTESALSIVPSDMFSTNILPLSWNWCAAVFKSFPLARRSKCERSWNSLSRSASVVKQVATQRSNNEALSKIHVRSLSNITLISDHWLCKKMGGASGLTKEANVEVFVFQKSQLFQLQVTKFLH